MHLKVYLTVTIIYLTIQRSAYCSEDKKNKTVTPVAASKAAVTTVAPTTIKPATSTTAAKTKTTTKPRKKTKLLRESLNCPKTVSPPLSWFPLPCKTDKDCDLMGPGHLCCSINSKTRCLRGIPKPKPELPHSPLLGVIPRRCPKQPLAEMWFQVKTCETDADCWPRVCCPDGRLSYCRSPMHGVEELPLPNAKQLASPIRTFTSYLQCTPPPPPVLDLFPKVCNNTLDCFPNLCCQEKGNKFCRPPQRSLLALVAGVTQRFGDGFWKIFTPR